MQKIDEQKYTQQVIFLKKVKDSLPGTLSFADEIADLLEVSNDSAYRRIRGETPLTFDEIHIIYNAFKIPFDFFNNTEQDSVTFNYHNNETIEDFQKYLNTLVTDLQSIKTSENGKVIYAAVDAPIFHYFRFKEISAFKLFYWYKEIVNSPSFSNLKFSFDIIDTESYSITQRIYDLYLEVPSIEIWTKSTINSMLRQIEFYWDSGIFQSKEDALIIIDQFEEEIKLVEQQAQHGSKKLDGTQNYQFYLSDIDFANNCGLVYRNNLKYTYLGFHTFNTIITNNTKFSSITEDWLMQLIKKSTLLSNVSQKQRYQFFHQNYQNIESLRKKILG